MAFFATTHTFVFFKKINKTYVMSKVCDLTGKKPLTGNYVSHSNRKTKRRFYPNLQKKKFYIPETQEWVTLKVSASAIRTINKLGIYTYIKKLEKKGDVAFYSENEFPG
jgi:large subunit ribosomal protein L28